MNARRLIENEHALRAEILVKSRRGKDFSGTPDFRLHVRPGAIIAAAPEPTASPVDCDGWAEAAKQQEIALFRQERTGAMHGAITASSLELEAFLSGETDLEK